MGIFGKLLDELMDAPLAPGVGSIGDARDYLTRDLGDNFTMSDMLTVGGRVLDAPRTFMTGQVGNADYWLANLRHRVGLEDDKDWNQIKAAYQRGGGREVWEDEIVGEMPMWQRALMDVAVDPLTYGPAILKGAGMLGRAGTILSNADDATRLARGAGKAMLAGEKIATPVGQALRHTDELIGKGVMGVGKVTGANWVARNTLGRGAGKLADVSRKTLGKSERLRKLLELTPHEQLRQKAEQIDHVVMSALTGGRAGEGAIARGQTAADVALSSGMSTIDTADMDFRAGFRDPVARRAQVLRNTTYHSPVTQQALGDGESLRRLRQRVARRRKLPQGGPQAAGIINVDTHMGPVSRWESATEREETARDVLSFMLREAPPRTGPGGMDYALRGLQDVLAQVREQYPEADRAILSDAFRYAREMAKDQGITLPSVRYTGRAPAGGGLYDLSHATDAERQQYAKNVATGILAAVRKGGSVSMFEPGGRFAKDGDRLRRVVNDGELAGTGLELPSFDEFVPLWENEFGSGDDLDTIRQYYDDALDELQKQMNDAAMPRIVSGPRYKKGDPIPEGATVEKEKGKEYLKFHDQKGMLLNADDAARLVKQGYSGLNFYSAGIDELRDLFESQEDLALWIDLMVVTSPRTAVRANVTKANKAFLDIKANRTENLKRMGFDDAFIDDLKNRYHGEGTMVQEGFIMQRKNLRKIEQGGRVDTQKQLSFRTNFQESMDESRVRQAYETNPGLSPEENQRLMQEHLKSTRMSSGALTNDMWNQISNFLDQSPTKDQFQILEAAGRYMADTYGMTPREFQAAIWAGVKGDYGYAVSPTFGTDDSPMNLLAGDLRAGGYDSVADWIDRGGLKHLEGYLKSSKDAVIDALRQAQRGGRTVLQPNLTNRSFYKEGKVDPIRYGGKTGAGKAENPGVTFLEHHIPAGSEEDMAKDLFKLKMKTDPLMDKDWERTRMILQPDGQGGFNVDVRFYPAGKDEKYVLGLQKRLDRARARATDTDDQLKVAEDVLQGFVRSDTYKESFRAPTGEVGNAKKLDVMVGQQVDEALHNPKFEGVSYRLDPAQGVVEEWPDGYAVSLASAGPKGVLDLHMIDKKTGSMKPLKVDKIVSKFMRDNENVIAGNYGDMIFFGGFPEGTPGRATFDMNIMARDAQEADEIGSLTNQIAYWDPTKEASVPPSAGLKNSDSPFKTADEIEELLDIIDDARYKGVSVKQEAMDRLPKEKLPAEWVEEARSARRVPRPENLRDPDVTQLIDDYIRWSNGEGSSYGQMAPDDMQQLLDDYVNHLRSNPRQPETRGVPSLGGEKLAGEDIVNRRSIGITPNDLGRGLTSDPSAKAANVANRILDNPRLKAFRDIASPGPATQDQLRNTDEYANALDFDLTELEENALRGRRFDLSQEESDLLYNTTFEDGTSIGDYMDELEDQIRRDHEVLADAGIHWEDTAKLADKKALTDDPDIKKIIQRWDKLGINPRLGPERAISQAIQKRMLKESGIEIDKRNTYEKAKAVWSELALTSPRYVMANLVGNTMDAMITGHFNFGAPLDIFRYAAADLKGVGIDELAASTKLDELVLKYGMGANVALTGQGSRAMMGTVKRGSQTRRVLERLHAGGLARVVETPMALAAGVDANARVGVYEDVLESVFEQNRAGLLGKLDKIAKNAGVETSGMNMLPSYDPKFVYGYYRKMGFSDGWAQRAAREVAEVRNLAHKDAISEVERVFLSYRKTNLDEMVGKVVPFHYWASRKVRFYAEEAMRNPIIMANYARAVEGIDRVMEDPGISARQKGFLMLMGGPAGFTLLMNPDALFGVIKATGLQDSYAPDGETEIGGIVRRLKANGVGLYPWIDGALNMMGMYGDTFEPDMLGIRHRALVGSVVNWMRGEGWLGASNTEPGAAPYADLSAEAREKVSGWASIMLPDWLSQPVMANAIRSPSQASLDNVIESRIIAEHPEFTNADLVQAMNDPESEAYQSAFQDAARAGVLQQLLSFSAPVRFRVEENTRDVRNAAQAAISKQADKLGIEPYEVTDTVADAEFRAEYKNQTGKEFRSYDWQEMANQEDLMNAMPEAREFVVRENEYQQIGGPEGKKIDDMYYGIVNGTRRPSGYTGDLRRATPEYRKWLAEQWLDTSGNRGQFEQMASLRRSYRAKNTEFGQFKDWQNQMEDLQALHGGSLAEYRRVVVQQNPAARQFFAEQIDRLEGKGLSPAQMEAELDRITLSSNAWFAINGRAKMQYDPQRGPGSAGTGDPLAPQLSPYVQNQYDPTQIYPAPQNQNPYGDNWVEALLQRQL